VASFSVVLKGHRELARDLGKLPTKVQRKLMRKSLRNAAKLQMADSRTAALGYSKGAEGRLDAPFMPKLAKGLKVRALKRSRKGFGYHVITPTRAELGIPPHYKGYAPQHIELGTHKAPALPYLRWPFDKNKARYEGMILDDINALIEEFNRGG